MSVLAVRVLQRFLDYYELHHPSVSILSFNFNCSFNFNFNYYFNFNSRVYLVAPSPSGRRVESLSPSPPLGSSCVFPDGRVSVLAQPVSFEPAG